MEPRASPELEPRASPDLEPRASPDLEPRASTHSDHCLSLSPLGAQWCSQALIYDEVYDFLQDLQLLDFARPLPSDSDLLEGY